MRMMNALKSVRSILTLWYSGLLLAACAVFGVAVYLSMQSVLVSSLEQNLLDEVDWIARLEEVDRMRFPEPGELEGLSADLEKRFGEHFGSGVRNYLVELATTSGRLLYRSGSPTSRPLHTGKATGDISRVRVVEDDRAGRLLVASRRADPFVITVGYSERPVTTVLDHILTVMLILAPAVILMAVGGGYLMAGVALRPVLQIARLTDSITAQRLDLRIPERTVDDELGKLIRTINTMIGRLERSFSRIREFSMDVAHELKTPLTIVKGEAELALADPATPVPAQRLAAVALEESARMSRIVDDLLTLARADEGQILIEQNPVRLDTVVGEIAEDAAILAGDRNLSVELVRNDPAEVTGDAARLRQMLRVLLTNAVLYTDAGGSIRIESTAGSGEATVSVADTGIGIPADSLDRIFERLYRVDEARNRAQGGSGLGLPIARWIAEVHGGTISVTSTPGRGSCFTVRLPLRS